jgi:hypothetical protein
MSKCIKRVGFLFKPSVCKGFIELVVIKIKMI